MDRGAWRATVHTVAKSQTGLSMHTRTHITSYKTWGEAWIEVWEVEVLLLRHWGASVHMRMNCCNPPGRSSRQGHRNECGWTGSLKTDSDIKTMKLQQGVVFYFACVFFFFKKDWTVQEERNRDGEDCFNDLEQCDPVWRIISNHRQVHACEWLTSTWRVIHNEFWKKYNKPHHEQAQSVITQTKKRRSGALPGTKTWDQGFIPFKAEYSRR